MTSYKTQEAKDAYQQGLADGKAAAEADEPDKLTLQQIKAMSVEEAAERLDEINDVLTEPVTAGGGDDGTR